MAFAARSPSRPASAAALLALAALVASAAARAQPQEPPAAAPAVAPAVGADDALRWFVEKEAREAAGLGRVEVRLGSLDPRLTLAPCRRVEPFVPTGARLWGRSAIGVRCLDGASWSVSLPVTVIVRGPALVAAAPLQAGAVPGPAELRVEEIELSREPVAPLADPAAIAGRVLVRPVAPGQPIRPDMLRALPAVQAGDPVRLVLAGEGFSITADGQALSSAADGQPIRVRTDAGRVLTGKVRGRTVEIRL